MKRQEFIFKNGTNIVGDDFRSIIEAVMCSCEGEDEDSQIAKENIKVTITNFRVRKK